MPIYEYVCKQCGKLTEVLQKLSDPPPDACPACGAKGPLEKAISRTSFVLKGGGWYSDLYGSKKKDSPKEGGESAPAPSGSGASTAPSPAASTSSTGGSSSSTTSSPAAPAPASSGDKK